MTGIIEILKSDSAVYLFRILIACLCGFIVGIERSKRQKDAGIRTHIIVALGSALMMIISKYGFMDIGEMIPGMRSTDGSRIASQIVSGVGFLGAGMIFINHKQSIKGLTTAAGIWTTAGIGMAVGAGMYFIGVSTAVLMLFLQLLLHTVFHNIDNAELTEVSLSFGDSFQNMKDFLDMLKSENIDFSDLRVEKDVDSNLTVKLTVKMQNVSHDRLLNVICNDERVKAFSV